MLWFQANPSHALCSRFPTHCLTCFTRLIWQQIRHVTTAFMMSASSIATIFLFFFFVSLFFFVSFILFTFRSTVHVPKRCQCYYGNSNELAPSLAQPWFVTILTTTRLVLGFSFGRLRNHILNPLLCFHFRSWSIFPPLCVGLEELLVLLLQFLPHFLTQSKR